MEAWELTARERIRDTIARYAHLVDRARIDELLELFTDDATLEAGDGPPAHGRAAIRESFVGTRDRLAAAAVRPLIRHHVGNVLIALEGRAVATVESYFLALTERGLDHWGRYRDRLVERDGRWLFQHRRAKRDGRAPDSVFR